ncbi:MAG: hypothetical protein J2P28_09335, partial [Actinobacteria bacterium]|nr:hypothetical protein [Actinomycetota bacterium]
MSSTPANDVSHQLLRHRLKAHLLWIYGVRLTKRGDRLGGLAPLSVGASHVDEEARPPLTGEGLGMDSVGTPQCF